MDHIIRYYMLVYFESVYIQTKIRFHYILVSSSQCLLNMSIFIVSANRTFRTL